MEVGVIPPVPCVLSGSRPCHIQCSADGKRVVYGTVTGIVSRCLPDQLDLKSKVVETFAGNRSPIEVAAISSDATIVAGGDNNGNVYIWIKGRDGVQLTSYQLGMQYVRITDLSFSDDSRRLAISGVDKYSKKLGTVIFVDGGNALGKIEGHTMGINSVSFRQKKPYLIASAGIDGLVCLHSGPPFKLIHSVKAHDGQVFCIRFAPDGQQLISCGGDGRLVVWDVNSGERDHDLQISSSALYSFAWSSDSARVAVVSVDHRICIVEVSTGTILDEVILGSETTDTPVRTNEGCCRMILVVLFCFL